MNVAGKIVLITGSTDGVGRMVAKRLGRAGAHVLVHGRDSIHGNEVVAAIQKSAGTAKYYRADLASLSEVRGLASAIAQDHTRLDVLVNNAGIGGSGAGGRRQESADGYELRFAVNYLAGFLLTRLLLDKLKASAPSRIINVSSLGQRAIDFEDVMLTQGYSGWRAYCQSKLAQILFTMDLADELEGSGVTANCLHPATYMDTKMVREMGVGPVSSVEEGCEAILNLVTAAELQGRSGLFFNGLRLARADGQAYDSTARKRLRELSLRLTNMLVSQPRYE